MRNTIYSGLLTLAGILSLGGQVTSAHAQVTEIFNYTGGLQTFVVPAGVTSLDVTLWGAGGGSYNFSQGQQGGGGAYVKGILTVAPHADLTLLVGGNGNNAPTTGVFGGGGAGNSSGGGRTAVLSSGKIELVDAGGGGGANFLLSDNGGDAGVAAGASGGEEGPNAAGRGGTQTAGGSGGAGGASGGAPGIQFQGGSGTLSFSGGGGGGGGYFGGGGGGSFSSGINGGGGGGSSYTTNGAFTLTASQNGGAGELGIAGGWDDPNYEANLYIGDGSGEYPYNPNPLAPQGGFGFNVFGGPLVGNGEIVVSYNLPASSTPEPGSVALLAAGGMCALGTFIRRRRSAR